MLLNSGYSYDQYHWWPIDLIEKKGFTISSIKYKIFNDGKQIINRIIIGIIVQIISILWFFNKNKFENLFINKSKIIYTVNVEIIIMIIITILWNEIKLSA